MINLAIAIGAMLAVIAAFTALQVHWALSVPLGLMIGVVVFIVLGRRVQEKLQTIMVQMQKDIQAQKVDRAIETLKKGYALKNNHLFVARQLNSQVGMLYYIKKDYDNALAYLVKGFPKHYVGQCMLAAVYYRRKDYDNMKAAMDNAVSANRKESFVYAVYAWLLYQIKEKEAALVKVQAGLEKLPNNQALQTQLNQLQNNKKMKMKVYGEIWMQFMLERTPRMQAEQPRHLRVKKKAMFR